MTIGAAAPYTRGMRRASLALVVCGLLLAGCGGVAHVRSGGGVPRQPQCGHGCQATLQGSRAAEIRAARHSNPNLFRIFPARPGGAPCAIPNGGLSAVPLKGTCRTSVTYPIVHGPYSVADVRFRERWGQGHSSSWVVLVAWPVEKVLATQLRGETSPQMRYAASDKTPGDQPALDMAAGHAERVAGAAHVFTGVVIDDPNDQVIVYLSHAPQSVIDKLEHGRPGTYVIHNDAPRTLHAVMEIDHKIKPAALKAQGIHVVEWGPTQTGYLRVGVTSHVAKAQAYFDAKYGRGVVRVFHGEQAVPVSDVLQTGG